MRLGGRFAGRLVSVRLSGQGAGSSSVRVLHVEYAERRTQYGIRFIFSPV